MSIFNSNLKLEDISSLLKDVKIRTHFVGILGAGMYPLARLLYGRGHKVSGTDRSAAEDVFSDDGIVINRESKTIPPDVGLMAYSLAVDESNPDILCAKSHGIPLISRAQLLGAVMSEYRLSVSVSGSHGKSTVTALIDHILATSGIGHTTVSGAKLSSGESFYDGGGDVFLCEACEYKDSFLRLRPTHQLITSVELDHTDYFPTLDSIRSSFLKAARMAEVCLINVDDGVACGIAEELGREGREVITYGRSDTADYRISDIKRNGDVTDFSVLYKDGRFELSTSLIGEYNLYNITAAVAMADMLGVSSPDIRKAVSSFVSIERRMTLISRIKDAPVYYDYAHHPTEIEAAIGALKERYGSVTVIFRPHTYSRTKSLWYEFISSLSKSDFTILLDIYPAREEYIDGVDSQILAKSIKNCIYAKMEDAARLSSMYASGAILLIGAGEVERVRAELVKLGDQKG